jgi:hypothetical protein
MNKAFTREPDSEDALCPRCGALGQAVERVTVEALVKPEVLDRLAQTASYCPTPTCEVAYFDAFERVVTTDELVRPVYPKDPSAPICACFGATCDVIEQDLAEGSVLRTRQLVEQAKSPAARCQVMSVTGKSCATEVQRYYMKGRQR